MFRPERAPGARVQDTWNGQSLGLGQHWPETHVCLCVRICLHLYPETPRHLESLQQPLWVPGLLHISGHGEHTTSLVA